MNYRNILQGEPEIIVSSSIMNNKCGTELLDGETGLLYPKGGHIIVTKDHKFMVTVGNSSEIFEEIEGAEKYLVIEFIIPEKICPEHILQSYKQELMFEAIKDSVDTDSLTKTVNQGCIENFGYDLKISWDDAISELKSLTEVLNQAVDKWNELENNDIKGGK